MVKLSGLLLVALLALGIAGCSEPEPEGYEAEDFSQRPPPEGFGPGGGQAAAPQPSNGQ